MKPAPVFWGNHYWLIDENGQLIQGKSLTEKDTNWIDYTKQYGKQSIDLCLDEPQKSLRIQLRKQIREDFLNGKEKCIEGQPFCILTHGGVASGKTALIELLLTEDPSIRDRYLHVDFDQMKKRLPEFIFMQANGIREAAEFTRSESGALAATVLKKAIKQSMNVIYEGSLSETPAIRERIQEMRKKNYKLTIASTHVSERKGQERAKKRFETGGRYVPPEAITATYKKCPKTLVELACLVDFVILINNELDNTPGRIIITYNDGNFEKIDTSLYTEYLQDVGFDKDLRTALK